MPRLGKVAQAQADARMNDTSTPLPHPGARQQAQVGPDRLDRPEFELDTFGQRLQRLMAQCGQMRVGRGNVGRIGHDQVEALQVLRDHLARTQRLQTMHFDGS